MKGALKIAAVLFLVFVVAPIVYSAFDPYIIWYFADYHARLTVDGKPALGPVHRDHSGRAIFVTRTDADRPRTYLIELPGQTSGHVMSCGSWVAPKFPAFAIGDLNPRCWIFTFPGDPNPPPVHPHTNLVTGPNFVEFTAYDGKRTRATW
jgi:hypothetical protein